MLIAIEVGDQPTQNRPWVLLSPKGWDPTARCPKIVIRPLANASRNVGVRCATLWNHRPNPEPPVDGTQAKRNTMPDKPRPQKISHHRNYDPAGMAAVLTLALLAGAEGQTPSKGAVKPTLTLESSVPLQSKPGTGAMEAGDAGASATPDTADDRRAEVQLLADRSALVPGQSVTLAIEFTLEPGWHIYWRNHGESGSAPTFRWDLPNGYTVGPMQFPAPKRHVGAADIHTFILDNDPILLTVLAVPSSAKVGNEVTFSVDAEWFICKEQCLRETQTLSLTLPVVASLDEAKPLHEDTFSYARRQLPAAMVEAEYLDRLRAVANVEKIVPGSRFEVAVVLDIADGFHLNSHTPLSEGLIATDVFADQTPGLFIERPIFPPGTTMQGADGQTMSLYAGRTVIRIPIEPQGTLDADSLRISGVVTYQACNDDTKQCHRPTAAEWHVTVPVGDAQAEPIAAHAELFKEQGRSTSGGFSLEGPVQATREQPDRPLIVWLVLAFVAGLLLNITPCVLPVVSIKILSFVQQASESPGRVFRLGLAFSFGMLLVFNVLAVLATVMGLAWGQHFQSAGFTIVLATIVFAFALSLFGVFTVNLPTSVGSLASKAEGEGYAASMFKGMFATIMGTPCVGPLLGPVLVWSATQPAGIVFLMFNTIGIGMTLPYALLTANPKWLHFVPKPGPWLNVFKQAMAFVLLGFVVYFLNTLEAQLGGKALIETLIFITSIGLACWIIGTWITPLAKPRTAGIALLIAVLIAGGTGWYTFGDGLRPSADMDGTSSAATHRTSKHALPWVDFSLDELQALTSEGKTVMLDITAEWCTLCKENAKLVFNTQAMQQAVAEYDVVPMLADWTNEDPRITKLINRLAPGASVPFCAIFPGDRPNEPIVMLGRLSKQQVIDAIKDATG